MIIPATLRSGGRIGICAPSGPVDRDRLDAAIRALRDSGFDTITSPSAFGKTGYLSAPDEVRAQELELMFARKDIDAVICARGGVGASRLLEILKTDVIAKHPKPFLGFSDNTALQWLLWKKHQMLSFSGPMAVDWSGLVNLATLRRALDVLTGHAPQDFLGDFPHGDIRVLRGTQRVRGRILPGNLTLINTLLGTPYLPNLDGAILLIEDVNEPPYRVDRMLFHLRNAGILQRLGALLCGEWSTNDEYDRAAVEQALLDATRGTTYPIITGIPYGHGGLRLTVPVGALVDVNPNPLTFSLDEPVTQDLHA